MASFIGIGVSSQSNPFEAGREAARASRAQIGGNSPTLTLVFASSHYAQEELIKGVRSVSGGCPLTGCSSAAQISPAGIIKRSVVVIFISSNTVRTSIGLGQKLSQDSRSAGQRCARESIVKESSREGRMSRSLFLMFPDGLTAKGEELIRGEQEVLGASFPIVGGASGDEFLFRETYQYYNDCVYTDSVAGVLIGGGSKIGFGIRHGWQPIGKSHIATTTAGNCLLELDGKAAIQFYEEYFKGEIKELKDRPMARISLQYPLGMFVQGEDEYLIRNVLKVNPDGSLLCAGEIPQGSEIQLMLGNIESAINAARFASVLALEHLKGAKPKLVLVFNSIARLKLLGNETQREIDIIRQIVGKELPIAGFYTYGEQAPLRSDAHLGRSYFHNETVLVVIIGE